MNMIQQKRFALITQIHHVETTTQSINRSGNLQHKNPHAWQLLIYLKRQKMFLSHCLIQFILKNKRISIIIIIREKD